MTTGIVDTLSMFVTNLSIFVMRKENVNQISVWEKIAEALLLFLFSIFILNFINEKQ